MNAYMQDDKDGNSRDARGKAQAYWAVKLQRCPTQRNDNDGSNGKVSVSRVGTPKKKELHTAYRTRDYGSGDGVLNSVFYTVC